MKFNVKYNVTLTDDQGEYEELRSTIAVLDYASAPTAASWDDPGDPGDFEWHFENEDGSFDTFAQENCSKHDRGTIEEYMTLGDSWVAHRNFRKCHGWDD